VKDCEELKTTAVNARTYRQAVTLFTEEMGYSPGDLEWIMGRGLAECLPWPIQVRQAALTGSGCGLPRAPW
jgi:hypothetical protein